MHPDTQSAPHRAPPAWHRGMAAAVIPIVFGSLAFLAVVGKETLDVTNIAWLQGGDPSTHFLGWYFFRHSPWSFPIGLNPDYGMELGSSIIYSDSTPLLALLFKPFSRILPDTFQYTGIWLLGCFVMQAWLGWKLTGLFSSSWVNRGLAAGLFVFSPPMLARAGGHFSLAGHFLVLSALYLAIRPSRRFAMMYWIILLAVAALVHAYLWVMVAAIWLADLLGRFLQREISGSDAVLSAVSAVGVVGLVCWQAGYFAVGEGVAIGGFGYYRMNTLALIDPNALSYFLPDITSAPGEYEGFNYLGLGCIVAAIFAALKPISSRPSVSAVPLRFVTLAFALLALTALALSNNIGIGTFEYRYTIPASIEPIMAFFRASGRLFWPVFYAIMLASIWGICTSYSHKTASVLLAVCLCLQVADSKAVWRKLLSVAPSKPSTEWRSSLTDPFWSDAAKRYKAVRYALPVNAPPKWSELAYYAGKNGLTTDAVHVARFDRARRTELMNREISALERGALENESLYILDDASMRLATIRASRNRDLLAVIDGLNVLAPGWKSCRDCIRVESEIALSDLMPAVQRGTVLRFAETQNGCRYLMRGWSSPESWGVWSDGPSAQILLPLSGPSPRNISIQAISAISALHPSQAIEMRINGVSVGTFKLATPEVKDLVVEVPTSVQARIEEERLLDLSLDFANPILATELANNGDMRRVAIGLKGVTLR